MVVVQFAPSTPAGNGDGDDALVVVATVDARHPVRQKYLVARSREKKNSIFDYVQLSSTLLRKIRYGQSLDAVLVARSPWGSETVPLSAIGLQSPLGLHLGAKSPLSPWGRAATLSSTPAAHRDGTKSVNQRGDTNRTPHAGTIQYGHAIQLQATDGGFLAVDMDDGTLCKLPKSHRDDPRTLLTLFPQDPLRPLASKPFVTTHELCFVVLGAATISEHHQVLYADSREIIEPPAVLRDAVRRHCQDHGDSNTSECRRRRLVDGLAAARAGTPSIVWSFRSPNVGGNTADDDGGHELLETGALVQLMQGGRTLHYETERIVKRKYTPLTSQGAGPESIDPGDVDATPAPTATAAATTTAAAPLSVSTDAGDGLQQTPAFTHVWLQQNDHSSQQQPHRHHHDSAQATPTESSAAKRKRWDNLWFIIDVATDRRLERERKQRVAELEAEEEAEADAARDDESEDSDDRNQRERRLERQSRRRRQPSRVPAPSDDNSNGTDTGKRMSVVHARVFVGQAASESQRHAAAIIVKFLRHVSRREAERRAKYLIDRRIRRTGKHRESEDVQLNTTQQLRVLQCFNPTVYGSQRVQEPPTSPSRRIAGVSLQGSKFPKQESNRLASMARDLRYLGSKDFQQQQHQKHVLLRNTKQQQLARTNPNADRGQLDQLSRRAKQQQNIARERERSQKLHVQLAMAHREKPPFHFGKPSPLPHSPVRLPYQQRPHTASGSPSPKR